MEKRSVFVKTIEDIHKRSGLSLAEFARRIDVPLTTLHHMLRGGEPTLDTALRIAKGLNVLLSELTGESYDEETIDPLSIRLSDFAFYNTLEKEDRREVRECFHAMLSIQPE